ncbi:MAG: ABC transporter permease [Anaerolineae bacterium]|nr:ABC transporter permease [Anaerolineae bacterium]
MLHYLLRRAVSGLIALFLFLTLMFFVSESVAPTDFTTQFSLLMTEEQRAALARDLGIDRPLWQRYFDWFGSLVRGDLGFSYYGFPVAEHLWGLIPYTLLVFLIGTMIAFQIGRWMGKVAAWRGPGLVNTLSSISAIMLYTAFPPFLAFLVSRVMERRLDLKRPALGGRAVGNVFFGELWRSPRWEPETVMSWVLLTVVGYSVLIMVLNELLARRVRRRMPTLVQAAALIALVSGTWYATGLWPYALEVLKVASIPIVTFVLLSFGETMLIMRTSMSDTLREDFITTAEAKGLPSRAIRDRHAARTALLPVFSRLVVSLPYLLTGLVILEDTLKWPGLSASLFNALYQQDIPVVMGGLVLVGVLSAITRLLLDVMYAYLDPRIRYDSGKLRRAG